MLNLAEPHGNAHSPSCERSDAIQSNILNLVVLALDCFAALAMTVVGGVPPEKPSHTVSAGLEREDACLSDRPSPCPLPA